MKVRVASEPAGYQVLIGETENSGDVNEQSACCRALA